MIMENNNNQEQNTATQAAQNLTSDNTGTQVKPLTTVGFHTLLAANTFELSKARIAYATEIADLLQEYDNTMDTILEKEHLANLELRGAREEFEIAKENYELTLRQLKKERNEAGRIHNEGKAEAKNRWAAVNEEIQSKRHDIFERYRNSGGALSQGTEGLLHPGWTKDKKGEMSDEEK